MKALLIHGGISIFTGEGIKAFLCAALFHDLGHFPFTHSLKELPLKDHEELSSEIILRKPLFSLIKESLKIDPYLVASVINEKWMTAVIRKSDFTVKCYPVFWILINLIT